MKLWKKILIVVLIVLVIFVIITLRKVLILHNIDKKVSDLENNNDNIYSKVTEAYDNKNIFQSERYIKNNIDKLVTEKTEENGNIIKITQITYPEERKVFTEKDGEKVMDVYSETAPIRGSHIKDDNSYTSIINFGYSSNIFENILNSILTSIKTVEIDGKQCYELTSSHNSNFIYSQDGGKIKAYVEKDTGLPVKLIEIIKENGKDVEKVTEYKYQFNMITDEDIKEPDNEEYKVQNN